MFVHPTADVHPSAKIGEGTRIWQFVVIGKGVVIGDDCNICSHVYIEDSVEVGDRVTIKNGARLYRGVTIQSEVFVGQNAVFTNDTSPRSKVYKPVEDTLVRHGASIGANAVIFPVQVGFWAMIGAGSVVTKDVPDHATVKGVPAR
jgi:acetyltransferase-like isoleucine patch superfamily enzyme